MYNNAFDSSFEFNCDLSVDSLLCSFCLLRGKKVQLARPAVMECRVLWVCLARRDHRE